MSPIYTRSGDQGNTGLANGDRTPKNSLRIEAIGSVDECNAQIGLLLSHLPEEDELRPILEQVQHQLFEVGTVLACGESTLTQADINHLEHHVDNLDAGLEPLGQFILPGGNVAAATAHVARTVCRRAERRIYALGKSESGNKDQLPPEIPSYMNRLSDLLFTIARALAARDGGDVHRVPGSRRARLK